jgi:hypothetical protein
MRDKWQSRISIDENILIPNIEIKDYLNMNINIDPNTNTNIKIK